LDDVIGFLAAGIFQPVLKSCLRGCATVMPGVVLYDSHLFAPLPFEAGEEFAAWRWVAGRWLPMRPLTAGSAYVPAASNAYGFHRV
jgi:hypothetical protein